MHPKSASTARSVAVYIPRSVKTRQTFQALLAVVSRNVDSTWSTSLLETTESVLAALKNQSSSRDEKRSSVDALTGGCICLSAFESLEALAAKLDDYQHANNALPDTFPLEDFHSRLTSEYAPVQRKHVEKDEAFSGLQLPSRKHSCAPGRLSVNDTFATAPGAGESAITNEKSEPEVVHCRVQGEAVELNEDAPGIVGGLAVCANQVLATHNGRVEPSQRCDTSKGPVRSQGEVSLDNRDRMEVEREGTERLSKGRKRKSGIDEPAEASWPDAQGMISLPADEIGRMVRDFAASEGSAGRPIAMSLPPWAADVPVLINASALQRRLDRRKRAMEFHPK